MTSPLVFFPRTLAEAVDVLDSYDGTAKVVAGGTALTLMLQQRLVRPAALVSLRRLHCLRDVRQTDNGRGIGIGALVTHAEAARHPLLRSVAPLVAEAFAVVGNAQVRAAATVAGVLAEADYASDPPAALRAADASVTVDGPAGERRISVASLLLGFYQTDLSPSEVVSEVIVPALPADAGSAYLKYSSRSSEDRPCVGVAAVVRKGPDGSCAELRVAVGAAADVPLRLPEVEAGAVGGEIDPAAVGEAYAEAVDAVSDVRGSAWYRREMVRVWVARAIDAAQRRCGHGEVMESTSDSTGKADRDDR